MPRAQPGSNSSQRQQTRDANHSNNNKAADHGEERIFVNSQHTAPRGDIANDQSDCMRLGSKFLWLRCNDRVFYCGKEMAEARIRSKVAPAGDRAPPQCAPALGKQPGRSLGGRALQALQRANSRPGVSRQVRWSSKRGKGVSRLNAECLVIARLVFVISPTMVTV